MQNIQEKLEQINQEGVNIEPAKVMKEAFDLFKKTTLSAASGLMLIGFILSFLTSALLVKFVDSDPEVISEKFMNLNPLEFSGSQMGIYLLLGSVITAVASIFTAGFIYSNYKADNQQRPTMFNCLRYFTKKQAFNIFIAQFTMSIIFSSISFALQLVGLNMVALAINWLINILLLFVVPLIIFADLSPFSSIAKSVMVVNKKPLTYIFIMLLNYMIIIMVAMLLVSLGLGAFFLVLGIFLTLPMLFSVFYVLYKHSIGVFNIEN